MWASGRVGKDIPTVGVQGPPHLLAVPVCGGIAILWWGVVGVGKEGYRWGANGQRRRTS